MIDKKAPLKKKRNTLMLRRSRGVSVGSSGRFAARTSNDKRFHLTSEIKGTLMTEAFPGGSLLMIDALMINNFRVRKVRGEKKEGCGSVGPAYGAGAKGHDTTCAIKERREYITILILLYTTFLRHIYADTKVEQAKMKKIRSFRIMILLVVVYHSAVA